jgi:hypothetical protein
MEYLREHQTRIQDVPDAGHFLLRAFEKASREIIQGVDDIWEAGTTTLLGGLILELEANKWCFLCVNVGDCKAFRWSHATKDVVDITVGNRRNVTDARDPGSFASEKLTNSKLFFRWTSRSLSRTWNP